MKVLILSLVALASFVGVVLLFGSIYIYFYFKKEHKITEEIFRSEIREANKTQWLKEQPFHRCQICGSMQPNGRAICLSCAAEVYTISKTIQSKIWT